MRTGMIGAASVVCLLCAAWLAGCTSGPGTILSTDEAIRHYVKSQQLSGAEALEELNKAVRADPTLTMAYVAQGDIQRHAGNYELARRAYEAACKTNPYYFRPHYHLGVVYQALARAAKQPGQFEDFLRKACDIYLRAVTLEPSDYDTNLNLSACYFQLGKYNQAEQYCLAAIAVNGTRADAYSNLGIIYDSQNRLYDAVRAYKQSLEINVHQPKLLLNLGSTYIRQGRLGQALVSFDQAAHEDPRSAFPHEEMGSCNYRMGKLDKALECYQKAASLEPRSPGAYRGIGVVYITLYLNDHSKTDLRDKGIAAWHTSLECNPNQDDLKKLLHRYTPVYTAPAL